jgi:hypothetical protein
MGVYCILRNSTKFSFFFLTRKSGYFVKPVFVGVRGSEVSPYDSLGFSGDLDDRLKTRNG